MNQRHPKIAVNPPVFFTSAGLLVLFLAFGVLFKDTASRWFSALLGGVTTYFGWLYILSVGFFIVFALWLLFSRYASIRLGDDHERPEFHTLTWFSMLFSAGMGIGLVFYGVAEPMQIYNAYGYSELEAAISEVNVAIGADPLPIADNPAGARNALPVTFFHWGIHAWAIYVLMALSIAYFSFRRKLPLAIRSCFYPLLGDRIHGLPGHIIDITAVFGTLFGLATSLGLGAKQVSAGLHYVFGLPHSTNAQILLIAIITLCAGTSLVTGVKKGIRRLSELNMTLAALLMLFVFLVGPTLFLLDSLVQNMGAYIGEVFSRTFDVGAFAGLLAGGDNAEGWITGTTLFYWGWWIAWCPFVGMFIARISRGRTIREFILGVLLVPTGVTFIWLTIFGNTALSLELQGQGIANAVFENVDTAIYVMLEELPLAQITSLLAAGVVAVFFVTSSDSASFVVDMLTSGGHPDPPIWQRVFWASAEGATAAVLLYAGGTQALQALQSAVVSIGLPFCIILLIMTVSLVRALREEKPALAAARAAHGGDGADGAAGDGPDDEPGAGDPLSEEEEAGKVARSRG